VRENIILFIIGTLILVIGSSALSAYIFRLRSRERVLLWFGLFAGLYGAVLIVRSPLYRAGFGEPQELGVFVERFLSLCIIVPELLLFEEFYGRGWRSSIRWLVVIYCVLAIGTFGYMVVQHRPELLPSPSIGLVVFLPLVLILGRKSGYRPPQLPNRIVMWGGLLAFFVAFSIDRLRNAEVGVWQPGLEPYGFLVLLICLGHAAVLRILADERQLASFSEEMRAATTIQTSILPHSIPSTQSVRIAVRYSPMSAVAGDLYDFPKVRSGCLGILVADVMGHGVPAALVASMVKVGVSAQPDRDGRPGNTIEGLNAILCDEAPGQLVTAVYVYLNELSRTGCYCAAAHPPPLLWRRKQQSLLKLDATGLLLGVRSNEVYSDSQFTFEAGDRLLVYTDGLVEAENAKGESFGDVMLSELIELYQDLDANAFAQRIQDVVLAWYRTGRVGGQSDDITLVVVDL
jgi:sigma-B regulation protein RsbU (phosphoserine phosphatase)